MPAKRKAGNSAPAARKTGPGAKSSRTTKTSLTSDDNESDVPPFKPAKRARGATSQAAKDDDDDDDDLGYGRGPAKSTTIEQHLMDQNKKSKEFISAFKSQIAEGREQTQAALAKLRRELGDPQNDSSNNMAEIFTVLQTSVRTALSADDNPLFEKTQQLVSLSHAILDCHRKAERDSRKQNIQSPREIWKQDEEGMRKLLEYGKIFGEKVVEGWISPDDRGGDRESQEESDNVDEGEDSEVENLAKGLFEWRRKGRGLGKSDESWGGLARKQMVAMAGVVRTLPSELK
ncbi:6d24efdd-47e8-48fc-a4f6-c9a3cf6d6fdb [Dichotomopilus funicola]|uniref:6d24efdd-47e8-48fc-a4f6-c9a3cf6d6fdb n=1 Tax=Dichotomopilus funicola TaxID=1934379 RepID=A0AAN6V152_9PEZI|nr:6d24efdd-47e8-48fc-a4f6-c9a3cf6d6fdb [Dichotomopilus funicola]